MLRHLDIAGVFALIAGTMTPIHAILFCGWRRWLPLFLIWTAAITGITLRTIFSESLPYGVGTSIFLVLGWAGMISTSMLWRRHGFHFIRKILYGGLAYSVGAVVLLLNPPMLIPGVVGGHELWHLAVLIGLIFHWGFVFQIANGSPPECRP